MNERRHSTPDWLPGLMDQVELGLQGLTAGRHDQRPVLEQELKQIEENIQGWSESLAKPKLPAAVREAIETQWAAATGRQQAIEAELSELMQEGLRAEQLVQPEHVLDRLDHLADVLAANDPTRGNLELSLHIDRITCYRDNRVTLRMCKLGLMPNALELLALSVVKPPGEGPANSKVSRARRRGKLRVVEDDGMVDLRAQADFITDPDRFVGLGDQFFWIDEFRIPESSSWAAEHAETVFRRRQESRFSYAKLAAEFGVTPPTIGATIRKFLADHPGVEDDVHLPRGGKRPPKYDLSKFADEARGLWLDGWTKEKLADKYGCSIRRWLSHTSETACRCQLERRSARPSRSHRPSSRARPTRLESLGNEIPARLPPCRYFEHHIRFRVPAPFPLVSGSSGRCRRRLGDAEPSRTASRTGRNVPARETPDAGC